MFPSAADCETRKLNEPNVRITLDVKKDDFVFC